MELFQKVFLSLVSLAQVEFKPAHTTACSSTGPPGSGSEVKGQYAGRKAPGLYFLNPLRSSGYTFYCFPGGGRKGLIMSKLIPGNNKHLNIQDRIYIESSLDSKQCICHKSDVRFPYYDSHIELFSPRLLKYHSFYRDTFAGISYHQPPKLHP